MTVERAVAALVTAGLFVCLWVFLYGRVRLPLPRAPRLAAKSLLFFAAPGLAALASLGRTDALLTLPAEFADARASAAWLIAPDPPLLPLLGAILVGTVIGGLFAAWRERRGKKWTLGNVEAVMPRNRVDLAWGVPLSIVAGVAEELFFRLALPLAATLATGSAVLSFALAIGLFGWAHRYQGWIGMVATGVVGAMLAALYLSSGSLLLVIVVHMLIDLNALLLRPLVSGRVRLSS